MKFSKSMILGVVALVLVAAGVVTIALTNQKKTEEQNHKHTTSQSSEKAQDSSKYVTYKGVEGKTALELLKTEATVVTKDSSFGPYVDSINGVAGGTDGKYWAFYVNGQMAQVGADAYVTQATDKVEWKFE